MSSPLPNERNHPFTISAVEVHCPPLARDVSGWESAHETGVVE